MEIQRTGGSERHVRYLSWVTAGALALGMGCGGAGLDLPMGWTEGGSGSTGASATEPTTGVESATPADSTGESPGTSTGTDPSSGTETSSESTGAQVELDTEFVDIVEGDVTLSARITTVTGDAPSRTLVLIHGGPGFSDDYMQPLDSAAMPGWRIVSFDQHGSGDSTGPAIEDWSLDRYAEDVEMVRAFVGDPTIHLFGHSWGALVSWAYLDAHPNEIASIAVLGGLPPTVTEGVSTAFVDLNARITMLQMRGLIPNPIPSNVGDDCTPSNQAIFPAYIFDPMLDLPAPFVSTSCRVTASNGTNAAVQGGWDLSAAAGAYAGPLAVWWGDADLLGVNFGPGTAPSFGAAAVDEAVFPDIGHYPWLEGDDFVSDLQDWMVSLE